MFKAGNVTAREQRRMIMRHLRHHFGQGCFEPEYKVQMLCDGHTEVKHGSIEYAYEDGEQKESIEYTYKNVVNETIAQLTRHLQALHVTPDMVKSIAVISGGDHGKGAFIAGSRIVVTLNDTAIETDNNLICSEIYVAEIICRKDNADILSKTIRGYLTYGLRTLAQNKITTKLDNQGLIVCSLVEQTVNCIHAVKVTMYVVGDLAFYGMILGKEVMSGKWCRLCQLSGRVFLDVKLEDKWTNEEMKR